MFGNNNNKTSLFGGSNNTNAFGSSTFGSNTGTNTFGMGQQQQQNSLFGGQSTGGFGSNTGSSNLFCQPAQSSGGLFGNSTPAQPTNTGFGTQTNTGGFGSTTANTGGGLFAGGSSMGQSNSIFGAPKFGASNSTPFGSSTGGLQTGGLGTMMGTSVKFNPLHGTDTMVKGGVNQSINTRHQCITCMKEYENKSLEELRFEDYQANRKAPGTGSMFSGSQTSTATGGLFSSSTSTPSVSFNTNTGGNSLFGAAKPAFGAATTSTNTTSIFSGSTFGPAKPFGSSTPAFGAPTQPTQSAAPATGSLFGTPTASTASTGFNTQSTNLFGLNNNAQSTAKPFFSAPSTSQPSLFGTTPANNTTNALGGAKPLFGASTPGAFGAPTTSNTGFSFNAPTSTATSAPGTSLFGTNTGGSLFGTNTQQNQAAKPPMFNFPSTNNSLTNTNTGLNTGGSLFNTTGLGGGLGTATNTGGSLFSSTPVAGGSLFGTNTVNTGISGSTLGGGTTGGMLQLQSLGGQATQAATASPAASDNLMTRLLVLPYGTSPLFQNQVPSSGSASLKFTTDPKTLNQYKVNFSSTQSPRNKQVRVANQLVNRNCSLLFDDYEDETHGEKKTAADIFVPRKSIKKLVIKPREEQQQSDANDVASPFKSNAATPSATTPIVSTDKHVLDNTVMEFYRQAPLPLPVPTQASSSPQAMQSTTSFVKTPTVNVQSPVLNNTCTPNMSPQSNADLSGNFSQNYSVLGASDQQSPLVYSKPVEVKEYRCKVVCTRANYFTIPSCEQLDELVDEQEQTCFVENFTVGRHDYGTIFWEGPIDVYGLNIDELVHIRRKEVIVYPDDENKAPLGVGLNRPAQVTLHKVWPVDKATRMLIKDTDRLQKMGYEEMIENATIKFDGIFKEYRPETGSWVFCVKHFSKYGLIDDDGEEEQEVQGQQQNKVQDETPQRKPFSFADSRPSGFQLQYDQRDHGEEFPTQNTFGESNIFSHEQRVFRSEQPNLFEEDETDMYEEDMYSREHQYNQVEDEEMLPSINNYYSSLRNALFEQDQEQPAMSVHTSKKSKKLLLVPDAYLKSEMVDMSQQMPVMPPAPIKLNFVCKRDLQLDEHLVYSQDQRVPNDIGSIKYAPFPKVRFFAGGNQFITVNKKTVQIYSFKLYPKFDAQQVSRFEHQLNENSLIASCDPVSTYVQCKGTIANPHNELSLESLIKALYCRLDFHDERAFQLERANLVIDWLSEQNLKLSKPNDTYEAIIFYLAGNDYVSAVREAIRSKNPKLALALNFDNTLECKNNVQEQLAKWKANQIDKFIPMPILRIYVLLSGQLRFRLSTGIEIDVLEGLTWTQQLNLLLLFSINNGLEECVQNITAKTNDVEYHLIAKSSPLVVMSSSANDIESWFLHQSLKSYGIIDVSINSNVIHGQVAAQLLSTSVRWACFVAAHINDETLRDYTLQELLLLHVHKMQKSDEEWLQNNLLIPKHFIAQAKSIFARSKFDYANLALHLIEQQSWKEAHSVLVEHIFPELVINEENEQLRRLLDQLKPYRDLIPGWYTFGAHNFDVYCQCVEDEYLDERLMHEPFDFDQMICKDRRQLLCKSEMARKMNLIFHAITGDKYMLNTPVPSDYALSEVKSNFVTLLKSLST